MIVSLMLAAALGLQEPPELPGPRECLDDNHTNRCLPEVQAGVRQKLGMASIEAEAEAGAEVYRVFFVDGYGRDMPAVAFERRPGQGPEAVVYGFEGRTIRAAVSADTWNEVIEQSRYADRRLAAEPVDPPATGEPEAITICLHGWVQTVELSNSRPTRWETVPVRRRTEASCSGELTSQFAFFVAEQAAKAIPPCDALDLRQTRNRVTQLAECLALGGDKLAAAEVWNARQDMSPRRRQDRAEPMAWRAAMGINARPRLDWAGTVVGGPEGGGSGSVAEFIVARLAEHSDLDFVQQTFEGRSASEVAVDGYADYTQDEVRMVARYRQVWKWDPGGLDWMLSEWTVEPFAPVT